VDLSWKTSQDYRTVYQLRGKTILSVSQMAWILDEVTQLEGWPVNVLTATGCLALECETNE